MLAPERLTLAEYTSRWLAHMASTREPSTVHRYRELLTQHVLPTLGGRQLKALQPLDVQALYDRLATSGRQDGSGGLHPRTVGHVHRCLHATLKQAVRWRLVVRNVCAGLEPPKVPAAPMVILSAAQARQLLEQADGWLHTLVLLGAATGARRGELLALRWANVDPDARTVRISRSLGLVAGELHWKQPKSEAGARTIVLGPSVVAKLRRHRASQAERRLVYGAAYRAELDLVVAKIDGGRSGPTTPLRRSGTWSGGSGCRAACTCTPCATRLHSDLARVPQHGAAQREIPGHRPAREGRLPRGGVRVLVGPPGLQTLFP